MYAFTQPEPNLIRSSTGHTIRLIGRAGLHVDLGEFAIDVDSEMLHPTMSIAVYPYSIPTTTAIPPDEILDEIVQGLQWAGFTVQLI